MGKRNSRRIEAENGNIGCMWGLIRMLHFRRDPKMLLDQRGGSRQYFISRYSKGIKSGDLEEISEEYCDGDRSNTKPTVKKLIEKEMTRGKIGKRKIPSDEIDKILSDWGHMIQTDNKKSKKRRPKSNSNPNPNPISNPNSANSTENSDLEVVIASFLVEIYKYHNECQLCKNKSGLCPTLKSVVCSKLNDLSIVSEDGHLSNAGVSESKEFMNALEILGSNKELFLKVLQDPDSHVLEKVEEINEKRDGRMVIRREEEKGQEVNEKGESRRFYKRMEEEGKSGNLQSASKIVVLKPKSTAKPSYDAKVVSHFSFREIKKRLRQIIGETAKERKDPYLFKVVNGMNGMNNKPQQRQVNVHATVRSSFYEEAKKHLTEILKNGNETESVKNEHVSIPLGTILSLTQSNLELNMEKNVEKGYNAMESVSGKEQCRERGVQNEINSEICLEAYPEQTAVEGNVNTIEIKIEDTGCISTTNLPVEDTYTGECTILNEASKEDPMPELTEQFEQSEEELIEESVSNVTDSLGNSIIEVPECQSPEPSTSYSYKEDHSEKADQDHPSPISVLEPYFSDDVPSPECKITDQDKLRKLQLPEWPQITSLLEDASARAEFIESVLEYSGLCEEESLERWYLDEELLEPSSFDELNIAHEYDEDDNSRLLFDCVCEVLTEIQHRYFRLPQQSQARKRSLFDEVCQRVDWHLRDKYPYLLDYLIGSDLDRDGWCDLREETDGITVEVWDELMDDLLEETVFDLWL